MRMFKAFDQFENAFVRHINDKNKMTRITNEAGPQKHSILYYFEIRHRYSS